MQAGDVYTAQDLLQFYASLMKSIETQYFHKIVPFSICFHVFYHDYNDIIFKNLIFSQMSNHVTDGAQQLYIVGA